MSSTKGATRPLTEVAVAVVEYRSQGYISTLESLRDAGAQTIVVSNYPDRQANYVQPSNLGADVYVSSATNVGFAAGANLAATRADDRTDYILFLNPDAEVSVVTVASMLEVLDGDNNVACVAPSLYDGGLRSPGEGGRELDSLRAFAFATGLAALVKSWRLSLPNERVEADWLSGACLLCRRSAFERVSGFDESYFLYEEDYDLGKRLRAAGYRLVFAGDLVAQHRQGGAGASRKHLDALRGYALGYRLRSEGKWLIAILVIIGIGIRAAAKRLSLRRVRTSTRSASLLRGLIDGLTGRSLNARPYYLSVR